VEHALLFLSAMKLAAGRRARETGVVVWGRKRQHGRVYIGGRSEAKRSEVLAVGLERSGGRWD
jgi:hypothetical protein